MATAQILPRVLILCVALAASACGGSGGGGGGGGLPVGTYVYLSGTPNPATAFDASEVGFSYDNNLTNGIWHANSNQIIVGEYSLPGYWSHPANVGGHPATPNNGTEGVRRLVHMPLTELAAYTTAPSADGIGSALPADLKLALIDRTTGALSAGTTAQFSDSYAGTCNVLSSSADELFILENSTTVRRYRTTTTSNVLTFVSIITLSQALAATAICAPGDPCYGGTFAWDGVYFYFARSQGALGDLRYDVYGANGAFIASYTALGGGGINSLYFDWSVGRYATHDGFGNRSAATVYASSSPGDSDTQCYGVPSSAHTFHP